MSRRNFDPIQIAEVLHNKGHFSAPLTVVSGATHSVDKGDFLLHVTRTGTGTCTIDLQTAGISDGRVLIVKDAGGGAASYNITITTQGSETIDGSSTFVMDVAYEAILLYSDGSNWFVF